MEISKNLSDVEKAASRNKRYIMLNGSLLLPPEDLPSLTHKTLADLLNIRDELNNARTNGKPSQLVVGLWEIIDKTNTVEVSYAGSRRLYIPQADADGIKITNELFAKRFQGLTIVSKR